ncbi:hypothetical protein Clacol_005132 [Clathrus columnatus]|uniref:Cerato-platanin n=1 Tax=Clathrus columnatus TaxID=1419009 RepID=A0AAV5A8G1_9AGAM|nr:hypothetical protein Clacol_005132 [Clathrus columnatus]
MYASTLLSVFLPLLAVVTASPAPPPTILKVTYDNTFDNPTGSLNGVACSNGKNGLVTRGFTDFKSLPSFPFIGGAQAVAGWNSTNCGTCWALTFNGRTINVLAIDTAGHGFNIAQEALDELTGGKAVQLGFVNAAVIQVPSSQCGL